MRDGYKDVDTNLVNGIMLNNSFKLLETAMAKSPVSKVENDSTTLETNPEAVLNESADAVVSNEETTAEASTTENLAAAEAMVEAAAELNAATLEAEAAAEIAAGIVSITAMARGSDDTFEVTFSSGNISEPTHKKEGYVKVVGITMDMRDPYTTDEDPWLFVGQTRYMELNNWLKSQIEAGYARIVTE